MLQEKLLRAYSKDPCIEINQAAVLLSLYMTTWGNVKQNYRKMLCDEPIKIDNDQLEINLNLLSFFPLWKAILTIEEAILNEMKQ